MPTKSASKTADGPVAVLRAAVKDAEKRWKLKRQEAREAKAAAKTAKKELKEARKRWKKAKAAALETASTRADATQDDAAKPKIKGSKKRKRKSEAANNGPASLGINEDAIEEI